MTRWQQAWYLARVYAVLLVLSAPFAAAGAAVGVLAR